MRCAGLALALLLVVAPRPSAGAEPAHRVEVLEMVAAILDGSVLDGPGHGWFHPGQALYGWDWLARRDDANGDGIVIAAEFRGAPADFARLDRDHDRMLRADDFDWSPESAFLRQGAYFDRQFRRVDADKDGRVTKGEWDAFFARYSDGKDELTPAEFRDALTIPPPPRPSPLMMRRVEEAPAGPSKQTLLLGLLRGEVGSPLEGPRVGTFAPGFTLPTRDGSRRVALRDYRGQKPVVLVFGSFTCGPFRQQLATVEDLRRRYADRAEFLLVYVREAHPAGGWRTPDNEEVGIAVDQPTTFAARVALADRCESTLKTKMPILVDALNDRVGHLYSGMPGRLYVVGKDGRVTYQGGRGPFGFKPGEMEQALLLTFLAESAPPSKKK